jgi:hypothetical protein
MVGIRLLEKAKFFLFPKCPDRVWGHLFLFLMGTGGSFPGVKAAGA